MTLSSRKLFLLPFLSVFITINPPLFAETPESKIKALNQKLQIAKSDSVRVYTLFMLSEEYSMSNITEAIKYSEQAYELALKTGDSELVSAALLNMGTAYQGQGLYEIAIRHYETYLEIQRKAKKDKEAEFALINIGAINLAMNNNEQANINFTAALSYFEKSKPDTTDKNRITALLTLYNNLGIVNQKLGRLDTAEKFYSKGILLGRKYKSQESTLSKLLNNKGSLYLQQQKNDQAFQVMNEALQLRSASNDLTGIALSYRTLAAYYDKTGDKQKSLDYLYKGLSLADSAKNISLQAEISEFLFKLYFEQSNADSALKYQLQYKDLTEKMNIDKSKKALTRMEIKQQYEGREEIHKMEVAKREMWYHILGVVLVFIVVIISMLYFINRYRMKMLRLSKENDKLVLKNLALERESLSQELQIKNKELATNVMYLMQKNEYISEVARKVKTLADEDSETANRLSVNLVADLNRNTDEKMWKQFELRFLEVHQDFYNRLNEKYPDLTPNEKKLAAFLRLNMTTKEISTITLQSTDSIRIARSRLRKKLGLASDNNLIGFLESF